MEYLTKEQCLELGEKYKYYKNCCRWEYWSIVIDYLKAIKPKSCLELGPYVQSLVLDGHTMDKSEEFNPTYLWDATVTPWPVKNKQYDVFVALQVWEHLQGKRFKAFREVVRISNWAILSFPYRWKTNSLHRGINKPKIRKWVRPYRPLIKPKIIKNRIIYLFNFSGKEKIREVENLLEEKK
jgi:hypothetical protein